MPPKYLLAAAAVACAAAIAATTASAQLASFTASYNVKATGRNGTPTCPDADLVCGTGTSPQFGAFTYVIPMPPPDSPPLEAILTFGDGTVLALTEDFGVETTSPGSSGDKAAPFSFGHPNTIYSTWTLDTADSSGIFTGLSSGSGTDVLKFAGIAGQGQISGVLGS
jgi:hypothetical protein